MRLVVRLVVRVVRLAGVHCRYLHDSLCTVVTATTHRSYIINSPDGAVAARWEQTVLPQAADSR